MRSTVQYIKSSTVADEVRYLILANTPCTGDLATEMLPAIKYLTTNNTDKNGLPVWIVPITGSSER